MQQLQRLVDALGRRGVRSWVDSGSLLGLARQGSLLPWDRDIDVGCWVQDREAALEVASQLTEDDANRLRPSSYRDQVFKVEIRPPLLRSGVKIDLSFWWDQDGQAYSPLVCNMPLRLHRGSVRWWLAQAIRQPMISVIWPPLNRPWPLRSRVLRMNIGVYLWDVPSHFFANLSTLTAGPYTFPVPSDWEGYLSYRYGEWRTPQPDWQAALDDGSARHVHPEHQLPAVFKGDAGDSR